MRHNFKGSFSFVCSFVRHFDRFSIVIVNFELVEEVVPKIWCELFLITEGSAAVDKVLTLFDVDCWETRLGRSTRDGLLELFHRFIVFEIDEVPSRRNTSLSLARCRSWRLCSLCNVFCSFFCCFRRVLCRFFRVFRRFFCCFYRVPGRFFRCFLGTFFEGFLGWAEDSLCKHVVSESGRSWGTVLHAPS